jgi:hypothetical protein
MNNADKKKCIVKLIKYVKLYTKYNKRIIIPNYDYMLDHYIKVVTALVGDTEGWIIWFIYDNNFGKSKLQASNLQFNIKMKTIVYLEDLFDIMGLNYEGNK